LSYEGRRLELYRVQTKRQGTDSDKIRKNLSALCPGKPKPRVYTAGLWL